MEKSTEDSMSKLQTALNKMAKGGDKAEEIKPWLRSITEQKTGLITNLINGMIGQWGAIKNPEYIKQSLHLVRYTCSPTSLRMLLDFNPDVVFPQVRKSKAFGTLLSSYIEEMPIEAFTGDEFVILAYLSRGKRMKGAKSKKLIEKLFDCLEYLKHPEVFTSIVALIITISYELSGNPDNYVIAVCSYHPNARYIEETLRSV